MTAQVAFGVRLVAALRGDVVLVARPSGVVHLHAGPLTRTGRSVPPAGRPVCGARTRRLYVVGSTRVDAVAVAAAGRRFCRTCQRLLPARIGAPVSLVSRDDWVAAYDGLTVGDLHLAGVWAQTVDDTWQVERLLMQLHGMRPVRGAKLTAERAAVAAVYDAVKERRALLTDRAMTDEERAANTAARDAEAFNRRLREKAHRRDVALAHAQHRERTGSYLLPHERELLGTA